MSLLTLLVPVVVLLTITTAELAQESVVLMELTVQQEV